MDKSQRIIGADLVDAFYLVGDGMTVISSPNGVHGLTLFIPIYDCVHSAKAQKEYYIVEVGTVYSGIAIFSNLYGYGWKFRMMNPFLFSFIKDRRILLRDD